MDNNSISEDNMDLNYKRIVNNTFKNYKLFKCISEAIINSIQANATKIEIDFDLESDLGADSKKKINTITIKDNGDGFNDNNIKSFTTYMSSFKENSGCKGLGRFAFLKFFKNILIESYTGNERVDIDFSLSFNKDENIKIGTNTNTNEKQTIIIFKNPIIVGKKSMLYDKNIIDEIYDYIYPFVFLSNQKCSIVIDNKEIINKNNITGFKDKEFDLLKKELKENFKIHYRVKKTQNKEKDYLKSYLCCNCRPNIEKNFCNLKTIQGYQIDIFLVSKWLDNLSDDSHLIDEKEDEDDLLITIKDVKQDFLRQINIILREEIPELENKNKKKIKELKEKYLHLADFINYNNLLFLKENDVINDAYKKRKEIEEKVLNGNGTDDDIKNCINFSLTAYILHRQKIIDNLTDLIKLKNTNKKEEEIHNLFFPKKEKDTGETKLLSIKENNIWLLDDKFMTYTYLASDKTIKEFFDKTKSGEGDSQDRPDIIMYYESKNKRKCCIIEFKKIDANKYDYSKGLTQLFTYSDQVYNSGTKEIYLYLFITNIDNVFRDILERKEKFTKVFSNDENAEVWQGSYLSVDKKTSYYTQVVSLDALITDANARNKTFLKIIEESKRIKEDEI
jgi:hypothetical protein